jgi:hypothetical protein
MCAFSHNCCSDVGVFTGVFDPARGSARVASVFGLRLAEFELTEQAITVVRTVLCTPVNASQSF